MSEAKRQAKAQRAYDAMQADRDRDAEKCVRCRHPRSFHNGGNRWEDWTICQRFLEQGGGSE